ncbi:lytic murein transglycosylase [Patescibacteria group bacterium]|nr:lytic murein transglycosylase [Patescibacteria group bacterium]
MKNDKEKFKIFYFLVIVFSFSFFIFNFLFAQEPGETEVCTAQCTTRQECEALLKKCEDEIAQLENEGSKAKQKSKTLNNQIAVLKKKVEKLNLQIGQNNIVIQDLGIKVSDTEKSVDKTVLEIENSKKNLAAILRTIYKEDQKSEIEILFSGAQLSDFFSYLSSLGALNSKNQKILEKIETSKLFLEEQKQSLEEDKDDLENVVKIQTLQKAESEDTKKEKDSLLRLTNKEYQKLLKEKEETAKTVAKIKARIFELIGVPEAPTFGEALDIARYVEGITGVRPAFLLAILQQESAIGKNVGQCYLKDIATGEGIRINTGQKLSRVMSPKRDVPPFLIITKDLGRDSLLTQVSCPMSFGWGGAMGPAQFIPSTWMLYKDRLGGIIGKAADPWNIKDAFLAASLYLSDYGAKSKTKDGEWKAAMIYFSGSTTNSAFYWYANNVLKRADGFEKDIAVLEATK